MERFKECSTASAKQKYSQKLAVFFDEVKHQSGNVFGRERMFYYRSCDKIYISEKLCFYVVEEVIYVGVMLVEGRTVYIGRFAKLRHADPFNGLCPEFINKYVFEL